MTDIWATVPSSIQAASEWAHVDNVIEHIDDKAHYLVQTNGAEWKDVDLMIMRGVEIKRKARPDYVRGRPVWVAGINLP